MPDGPNTNPDSRRVRHRRRRMSLPGLALGLLTLAFAGSAIGSLSGHEPDGRAALSGRHENNADAALRASPAALDVAARENDAILASAPLSSTALVRKAFIIQQQGAGLDAAALASLESSYQAAPHGPDISRWRMRFMFENWSTLSPGLRERAIRELEVYARFHGGSAAFVRTIQTPSGRLAATLVSRRAYRQDLRGAPLPGISTDGR